MKQYGWALAALGCLVCSAAIAEVPAGFYMRFNLGLSMPNDEHTSTNNGTNSTFSLSKGPFGELAFGYRKLSNFRPELAFSFANNNISEAYTRQAPSYNYVYNGYVNVGAVMANLFYDFNNESNFTPYLGAGAGYAWFWNRYQTQAQHNTTGNDYTWNYSNYAMQGLAGISYNITSNFTGTLDYRYFYSPTKSSSYQLSNTPNAPIIDSSTSYANNTITLGLMYVF